MDGRHGAPHDLSCKGACSVLLVGLAVLGSMLLLQRIQTCNPHSLTNSAAVRGYVWTGGPSGNLVLSKPRHDICCWMARTGCHHLQ